MGDLILGVDIGGTFTDLVVQAPGGGPMRTAKVPSTPADPSRALMDGLHVLGIAPEALGLILHGTTVATNAVLERKGADCGLIMTEGFRDVLELRRRDRPDTYGLRGSFTPLVPRERRLEVAERTTHTGRVEAAPDAAALEAAARRLWDLGARVVVVSFINAYANPENELAAAAVLRRVWPNAHVVSAAEVLPEIREFERTTTGVLNGYVQPMLVGYLDNLMSALRAGGYAGEVLVIQSNGGVMSQEMAGRFPVNTLLSGPAAGVSAAGRIGADPASGGGLDNLITCDIGGTSLDIAVIVGGQPATARDMALEYGLPIRVPMLDIRTVGAGGGSIAWLDGAGLLNIGPQSAGAQPGPVCYGQGGAQPTVTDANVLLGRINPQRPIGEEGRWRLHPQLAEDAIAQTLAGPLSLPPTEAAWAILGVANQKIAASIRKITVEQGLDPRDFTLLAFGGGGPLHAGALLEELGIPRALIPPWPGMTSAIGCLTADVRHDLVRSLNQTLDVLDLEAFTALQAAHQAEGLARIAAGGVTLAGQETLYQADMAYDGQIHEVRTPLPPPGSPKEALRQAFEAAYAAQYGQALSGRPVRLVTLRTSVIGRRAMEEPRPPLPAEPAGPAAAQVRPAYFAGGWVDCPAYRREALAPGQTLPGPAIVEQADTTTVVEPGQRVRVLENGAMLLEVLEPAS